jgi:hypothetical protein
VDGDGNNDLLAVRPDGATYLYSGPGTGKHHGPRTRIAADWNTYTDVTPVGDYDGDGTGDVIFRKADGTLWLRTGLKTYSGGWFSAERRIGTGGWNSFNRILGPGDFNSDGKADILATKPTDGSAHFYAGTRFITSAAILPGVFQGGL